MSCLTLLRTLHLLGSQLTPRGEKQNNNMKTTNDSSTLLLQVTLVSLSNPIMMRDVRDYLTSSEVDRTHVALNVCRCCHVEIEPVFATWGLSLIKNGRFEEAREKFQGCLKNAKEEQHETATTATTATPSSSSTASTTSETVAATSRATKRTGKVGKTETIGTIGTTGETGETDKNETVPTASMFIIEKLKFSNCVTILLDCNYRYSDFF